ncbi:TIGR01777 family protein [Glaciihabitans arcticus]|uniref:TIGR01777 family protein n=1 Tax=Glaciihabitans arcticus TaxID=2668039 RepID=A0A4Q9GNS7_9MICO|nr:TIGR01777 family oxidoreductase [Glaciihabitans arcticus]TBN56452.1 TIGR01777 family protein [Glaciihabitans arcticus]
MAVTEPLRVLVSGASGFIGTELRRQLGAEGHTVLRLVRREPTTPDEFEWDPSSRMIDATVLDTVDAVINLSGAPLARFPWTRAYKRQILSSRVDATATLAEAILLSATPPKVLINGSAVGFYGDRPGIPVDETAPKGDGFLADVVDAWEQAAHLADSATRVVTARTGLVVGPGGAFAPLSLATKFGLASRMGPGTQDWPWISLHDEAAALVHLLTSELSGPVNLAGPVPATSEQVTRAMARALHRWHPLVIPTIAIRTALGEAGVALLLKANKQVPSALLNDGFEFRHSTIDDAIAATWK